MKINTKSWHFRLMRFANVYPYRHNLCEYIRGVMLAFLKVLIDGGVVVGIAALIVICLIYSVVGWFLLDLSSKTQPDWFSVFLLGNLFWLAAAVGGVWWSWTEYRANRRQMWRRLTKQQSCKYYRKELNVFLQWIKDRHKKVCRLIEFV